VRSKYTERKTDEETSIQSFVESQLESFKRLWESFDDIMMQTIVERKESDK